MGVLLIILLIRGTKQQWQVLVVQHAQSGLTTRDFCQQPNIHLQTFYSRRHALGLVKLSGSEQKTIGVRMKLLQFDGHFK
jgi:hypothetical protein